MNAQTNFETFRDFLHATLESRIRKNPKYSLRAFARDLRINDSTLSQLLSGKRTVTIKHIEQLGASLKLTSATIRKYLKNTSKNLSDNKIEFSQMTVDSFSMMADWFHDAILELLKVSDFQPDESYISKALGIHISQARGAIQRLKRLGLISADEGQTWVTNCQNSLVNFDLPTSHQALKEYQKQILDLSKESIEHVDINKRNHTSFVVALDSELVEEVSLRIRQFQKQLIEFIESESKSPNEVYAIQFASFPLTKPKIKGDSK